MNEARGPRVYQFIGLAVAGISYGFDVGVTMWGAIICGVIGIVYSLGALVWQELEIPEKQRK